MSSFRRLYVKIFFSVFLFVIVLSFLLLYIVIFDQKIYFFFKNNFYIGFFIIVFFVCFCFSLFAYFFILIDRKIKEDILKIKKNLVEFKNLKQNESFNFNEFAKINNKIYKLFEKIKKREEQRNKFNKKLRELNKKQSEIISAISHEFKNPVAAILGYSQSLYEDEDLNDEIRKKFIKKVINNTQKINNMIDRLSLAVKVEGKNFVLKKSEFLLKELILEIKDTLLQKYKDRNIVLNFYYSKEIKLYADKILIEQVLINLAENALKYSDDDIFVNIKEDKIEIEDRGIGIKEENIKKITQRFFRVNSLKWNNSLGVGLYIVKYILKLHNVKLNIKSEYKKGSVFWFSLKKLKKE